MPEIPFSSISPDIFPHLNFSTLHPNDKPKCKLAGVDRRFSCINGLVSFAEGRFFWLALVPEVAGCAYCKVFLETQQIK